MVALTAIVLAVAAIPMLVLLDLVGGGNGWGLCPDGITSCRNPYTAASELALGLTLVLFLALAGIRVLMRVARRLQAESFQIVNEPR